jgi:hypothetical protein
MEVVGGKVARRLIYANSGRLLASYFFFCNAGERSTMKRFTATLASQLVAAVPAAAKLIDAALSAQPRLLAGGVSLAMQLEQLVYQPFRAVVKRRLFVKTLAKGPFLMAVDGLDECKDKRTAAEFITITLNFFKTHPSTPLRIFIASCMEKHISAHLKADKALVTSLDNNDARDDIEKFLEVSFHVAAKQNPILQAYIQTHGQWPSKSDMGKLVAHIGGCFVNDFQVRCPTGYRGRSLNAYGPPPAQPNIEWSRWLVHSNARLIAASPLLPQDHIRHCNSLQSTSN